MPTTEPGGEVQRWPELLMGCLGMVTGAVYDEPFVVQPEERSEYEPHVETYVPLSELQQERQRLGEAKEALRVIAEGDVPNVEFAESDLICEFAEKALAALDQSDSAPECENCGGVGSYVTGDAPHDESHSYREACPDCQSDSAPEDKGHFSVPGTVRCSSVNASGIFQCECAEGHDGYHVCVTPRRTMKWANSAEEAANWSDSAPIEEEARADGCICPFPDEPGYVCRDCPVHDPDGTFHVTPEPEQGDAEDRVTVTFSRDEARAHVGVGPITSETPCLCGAIQPAHYCPLDASARQKISAALHSTTKDPEEGGSNG